MFMVPGKYTNRGELAGNVFDEKGHKRALHPPNETQQHEAHCISLLSNTSMLPLIRILCYASLPSPP